MLSLRDIIVAVVCVMATMSATRASAADLRISHQWSAEIDARDRAARLFASEVQKRAPGVKITIHPNSSLGIGPVQQYDALIDGRIEMAIFPMFYLSPRVAEMSITLMPGVPASTEQAQLLRGSEFHRIFQQLCESKGIRVLTWWWLAGGMVSTEGEIGGPDDVKGLSVRTGDPTFDLMFASLGAIPQVMPSTEIAARMKAGKLDLAQSSLETLVSLKLPEVAKSAKIGGPSLYVALQPLVISTKAWNALSDAERAAFTAAADIADTAFQASQREAESQALAAFASAGVKVTPMPQDEYEQWLKIANDTSWRSYRESSPTALSLFNAMLMSLMDAPRGATK